MSSRRTGRDRARRALGIGRVEPMEERVLMAAPVIDPIASANLPAGKSLIVPVTATDADQDRLTYTVTSKNPDKVTATLHQGNPFVQLDVANYGKMQFELLRDVAPNTVDTVLGLVNRGFYNGLTFHRVVPDFVIQGGDPSGNGSGGPGFRFSDEFNPQAIFSGNGQLAMANSGKDTNGSQFFVTVGAQRFLDFNHTIFGQIVRGGDVLSAINKTATGANDRPITDVKINSASMVKNLTDAVLTLQAKPGATGTATITVTADDGHGQKTSRDFQVQIGSDGTDDPPILGPVFDQLTAINRPVSFSMTSTDLEGNPVEYDALITDATPRGTVAVNGNVVTVTPDPGFTGSIQVLTRVKQVGATSRGSASDPYDSQAITVRVVSPSLSALGVPPVQSVAGVPLNDVALASFRANVPSTSGNYSATISWGDGGTSSGQIKADGEGGFRVLGTHAYSGPATFPISVSIADTVNGVNATAGTTAEVRAGQGGGESSPSKANLTTYRPSNGEWRIDQPGSGTITRKVGPPGGIALSGDFDGDGKPDLVTFDPGTSHWFIVSKPGDPTDPPPISFGAIGDVPVPADYDGDGKTDLAVFRPSTQQWFIRQSTAGPKVVSFGAFDDIPVPADYDGDGKADLAVYRPNTGQW
ncbi:MAG: peptidylprolyl isomerase, partial [Isosphaeraceae bacterium]